MPSTIAGLRSLFALSTAFGIAFVTPFALAQDMPPAPVGVVVVESETIPITAELPGRISATQIADVRPRVGGIIESRDFEQGSVVEEGDILFRLDRVTYEVSVEAARANVARAEAALVEAEQSEARFSSLSERNIASRADLENAVAVKLQAQAALAEAQAQLRAAEVNLSFTEIRAPISGRIGRAQVTEGALVAAGGEVLTTIQQLDPVYADAQQPVSQLLQLRRAMDAGELTQLEPGVAQVELYLDDGSLYPHPGRLLFAEAAVERTSGQVTLRAEFPNPDNILLPGMYVRVLVEQAVENNAIAIPSQAIQRDASGATNVYVVTPDSVAELRPVVLGRAVGNRVMVHEGLAPGDALVVDGFQKMGPGAPVGPVCWTDPSQPDAAPSDACTQRFAALTAN